ncbi:craniofacial development protein 2-like [Elysia marginata]|uniref:Craniofacial development protein 2-like n=1 Tax=Elysia marginata TaxID=1093978 RepID=A0AAV4JDB7_9GAST|nr:craniofacial development protein 2-like [Elysia marginata]
MSECTSQDPLIIMGDFNAKVGQHGNEKAVGKHGLCIRNERAKSYPGADCYSDHIPVIAKFRLKLKNEKRRPRKIKLNLALLKSDLSLRQRYSVNIRNEFQLLGELEEPEEQWHQLITAITEAATEEIPPTERRARQRWMTNEILEMMDKRRQAKNDKHAYETLHKQIRKKCDEAKEKWLNEKCKNMDLCGKTKPHIIYQNTEEIVGRKTCSSTG